MTSKVEALKLKGEGKTLYGKRDYLAAYTKYSEAIQKEGQNAVLYTNRAAYLLSIEKAVGFLFIFG